MKQREVILAFFVLICCAALFYVYYDWLFVLGLTREIVCGTPQTPWALATIQGRIDTDFPSPRCCDDWNCKAHDKHRYAVLTTLRSPNYFPLLEHLACSMEHSNPGLKLLVAIVAGDLPDDMMKDIAHIPNVEVVIWEEFRIPNALRERFSLNWVKLRAWEMDNYDMLLMIDADTIVIGDVSSVFTLPAHFATVLDQDKLVPMYNALGRQQGGWCFCDPVDP